MTLLTIDEAAEFLRLTKRTLYQRVDIPRVRYGHRVMFIKEDLEKWVLGLRDQLVVEPVDLVQPKIYHRNPIFLPRRSKSS